jgi:hypothetical protein
MRRHFTLLLVAALAVSVAACGSDDKESSATDGTAVETTTVETAAPDTVADTTPATDPSTTLAPAGPVYPLTGLPVTDPAVAERPALVVKIDNNAAARPQSGLNEADIVFEEIVEVQTRFAAVFHSTAADPVGPIRSGRTQDIDLLGSFNRPLLLWSGGNKHVTKAIENSDLVNLSAQRSDVYGAAGFFRSDDRKSPHDLYASSTSAWTLAPEGAAPPAQQFRYRAADAEPTGEPGTAVDLDMDGLPIEWRWDDASGTYLRSNGGTPHNDALSGQVSTHNVVIMVVEYRPSPADPSSPEAQTIGSGQVLVYSGGVLVHGTWSRSDRLAAFVLTDSAGNPIELTPGRTFVELARAGTFSTPG